MSLKALIFDFDGVITNTEPIHLSAWRYVLKREGIKLSDDEYKQNYIGMNDRDFVFTIGKNNRRPFSELEFKELFRLKLRRSLYLLKQDIPLIPGVEPFVTSLSKKMPLAICTGSVRQEISFILNNLGWNYTFSAIVTGDDVHEGKPHPQGYLLTLSKLKQYNPSIKADSCLVIEDSPKGVAAAKAAGIQCLAVTSTFSKKELDEADWHADNLQSIPNKLSSMLGL